MRKIIHVGEDIFEVLGTQRVNTTDEKGTDYWKKQWNADSVLRSNNEYYYCRIIVDAEFEDI